MVVLLRCKPLIKENQGWITGVVLLVALARQA
jgi:hypothetical protein